MAHPWLTVGLLWLLCCIVMLWGSPDALFNLGFRDADDAMRLQQVRDWLGGQGWFDVSQHRVNPPQGGPMHWSRIVDIPIAALILLLRPLTGMAMAESLACIITPLLLLGALVAISFAAIRHIGGQSMALIGVLLLLLTPAILIQFPPLRIDHHNWQICMAALCLFGLMHPHPLRGGAIAGLALAIWLQISSESVPYAALFSGTIALWQWLRPTETPRLTSFAVTLGIAALLLLVVLKGAEAPFQSYCDALSAAYVWSLLGFAIATPAAALCLGHSTATRRFLIAALGGGTALIVLAMTGGTCLSGDPFQSLSPLAYKFWYVRVLEGRPIWEQSPYLIGSILLPSLFGLVGTGLGAWSNRDDQNASMRWLMLFPLLIGATLVAVMVMRAMSVAHLLAIPGLSWILLTLLRRTLGSSRSVVRVLGSASLVLLTPGGISSIWVLAVAALVPDEDKPLVTGECRPSAKLTPLTHLPKGTILASLDIGPTILVRTPHSVIGTGHHRNAAGITAVIQSFTDTPAQAEPLLRALNGGKGVDYVVTCTELTENEQYIAMAPHGLAAQLYRNHVPAWLQPLPGKGPLHIYKMLPQPGTKAKATPFMQ